MGDQENLLPQRDAQDVPVFTRCRRCGRELYAPDGECDYCRRFFA